ncbi:type IX secretion system anionic LPS delivery protein PorZ [Membranihabitans maritimus]|uniref:type IX secretion system anionic LPS delivery protein PorZ n=1 Tax=Membranihabitans maritimus TaxID=2904244 RepID=UPI001F164979|nr:two-component regulator propeller domain-containing protein [Membranihabitans maritimus]
MIRTTTLLFFMLGFSCLNLSFGQENSVFGLGEWKSYFPSTGYFSIQNGDQSIIVNNRYQVSFFYPEDREIISFNKVNGLSDIGISNTCYISELGAVVIGYENGNIDILTPDETYNLSGIKNNENILVSKEINDIVTHGNSGFLATDFGIVQIDLAQREFVSTLFTDSPIHSLSIDTSASEVRLLGASSFDLFSYSLSAENNFADINQWDIQFTGLEAEINGLEVWDERIYFLSSEKLFEWNAELQLAEETAIPVRRPIRSIKSTGNELIYINDFYNILRWDGTDLSQQFNSCLNGIQDVTIDDNGVFWYIKDGYIGYFEEECVDVGIDGVPSEFISEMGVLNGALFVATGGVTQIFNNLFREDGFYTNDSMRWKLFGRNTHPELMERNMRDLYCIETDPVEDKVYIGSFWDGLVEYSQGQLQVYDDENSTLRESVFHEDRIRISDLFREASGNLWMSNHYAPRPIVVRRNDGEWFHFSIPVESRVERLVVDDFGMVWIDVDNIGIVILDPGDWNNNADDRTRIILPKTGGNGTEFDNASINEMAVDREGVIWIGTENGPVRFDCGGLALEDICEGRKPVIEVNNTPGVLLRGENVKAIAIDPGNRKWFGTENGVYVINRTTESIEHHFTVQNSPLPSDNITDISIDDESGEVYIATEEGLVSYKGEATLTDQVNQKKVVVYPNPVPPDFNGRVGIKELSSNALVRITSLDGRLIYENRATGGQLVWDRVDQDGRPVKSGVYLVFATSDESLNPFTQVGKVFILN